MPDDDAALVAGRMADYGRVLARILDGAGHAEDGAVARRIAAALRDAERVRALIEGIQDRG